MLYIDMTKEDILQLDRIEEVRTKINKRILVDFTRKCCNTLNINGLQ